jgi:hypothetical protein
MTYAGKSLLDNWPKTNDTFDGGWRVTSGNIVDNYGIDNTETSSFTLQWSNTQKKHAVGDTISTSLSSSIALLTSPSIVTELTFGSKTGHWVRLQSTRLACASRFGRCRPILELGYDAARDRQETISFVMRANFQSLVTVPDDTEVKKIDITGGDVGSIDPGGEVPIGSTLRRTTSPHREACAASNIFAARAR